ncbi:hypothetical protein OOZ19_04010 [Saccharopolyspora sp. NFXS83]|uniref:hypothetical protein n=1 Tax=Saccharopolyspora sp. NFXS83 TaxID=2993560 RepID=UPI00224B4490|nr:hypothetical protein [Saccharopolyspora sp. NFXS83]MCX2729393.1 hypothetical protein [Saccharopolyspora sp. NFXS83]
MRATSYTAAAASTLLAVIHLVLAPDSFEDATYLGVLFVVGAVLLLGVAYTVLRRPSTWAWLLGSAVSAGMFLGFVLSRTTGLPGFREESWEPAGWASLVLELVFLAAAARALGSSATSRPGGGRKRQPPTPRRQ